MQKLVEIRIMYLPGCHLRSACCTASRPYITPIFSSNRPVFKAVPLIALVILHTYLKVLPLSPSVTCSTRTGRPRMLDLVKTVTVIWTFTKVSRSK